MSLNKKQYQKQNFRERINQTTKWTTDLVEKILCHLEENFPAFHRIQNALPCLQDLDSILNHLNPEEFYLKYTEFINIGVLTGKISMTSSMELMYFKFNLQYHRHDNLNFAAESISHSDTVLLSGNSNIMIKIVAIFSLPSFLLPS